LSSASKLSSPMPPHPNFSLYRPPLTELNEESTDVLPSDPNHKNRCHAPVVLFNRAGTSLFFRPFLLFPDAIDPPLGLHPAVSLSSERTASNPGGDCLSCSDAARTRPVGSFLTYRPNMVKVREVRSVLFDSSLRNYPPLYRPNPDMSFVCRSTGFCVKTFSPRIRPLCFLVKYGTRVPRVDGRLTHRALSPPLFFWR